ncbi:MAG: GtrA family protein [Patescibacteria group bacterium]|nr:GtrA family protein [Patescibacteria group bacterium]
MKKIDIIISLVTGEGIALLILWFIKKSTFEMGCLDYLLPIFFPILTLIGLWVSYLIGKKYLFFFQLVKFLLIGSLFAIFDLLLLNFLMGYFEVTEGVKYSVFVTASFVVITSIKYIADKFWAFEKSGKEGVGMEFMGFFIITLISGVIHIGVASFIVNVVGAQFSVSSLVWANIGKILGIIVASIWNFLGYKFIVFKK